MHILPFTLAGTTPRPEDREALGHGHSIPDAVKARYREVAAKAVELQRQGMSLAEIAEELNRLGFRTRTGLPWRDKAQIHRLIRDFGRAEANGHEEEPAA